jgi:hypothetical protein
MVAAYKKPRNPFSSRNAPSQSRHALARLPLSNPAPQKHASAFQQFCYAILVGSSMVTFLSWAVPVANPTPTKPIDLHQAMMLSEKRPQQQQQQDPRGHSIPRRGGGIRGQSKLLLNPPESVLANTNHSSSRTTKIHGPPAAKVQAPVDANTNEWDPDEDPDEQEDIGDETKVNRWIDDTKELVRKVDASMHALIDEGVFGRERTESEPIRTEATGDSSDNVAHVPQDLDEVYVVGGLSDSLDGSRSESLREKEQPGGPDEEESSSRDERDKVHVIGGREPLHEKEQPGGPDEEASSSRDERDKIHENGGLSNSLDGSRSESLREQEQPGGPEEEESSPQDERDKVHVIGGREPLHEKEQPEEPDEESPLQDTAEKVEYRPGNAADGKHKGTNRPPEDEMHSSRDDESDTKQEAERSHDNLLPTLEMPALTQQRATFREKITTQEKTSPLHETSAVEESPGRI